mmetsp:Transcript_81080/g.262577  ORF Transcript_81080/g.262577 Transcript_81080/m.262577 type:complete len:202 (-) Transcript_81080:1980-2585(-)
MYDCGGKQHKENGHFLAVIRQPGDVCKSELADDDVHDHVAPRDVAAVAAGWRAAYKVIDPLCHRQDRPMHSEVQNAHRQELVRLPRVLRLHIRVAHHEGHQLPVRVHGCVGHERRHPREAPCPIRHVGSQRHKAPSTKEVPTHHGASRDRINRHDQLLVLRGLLREPGNEAQRVVALDVPLVRPPVLMTRLHARMARFQEV